MEMIVWRTFGEVRSAVAGYREVTLTGELASVHEVLRVVGIEVILLGAVDIVDADVSESFGWVVREVVINVVWYAWAICCIVDVGSRWIEIVDDGIGSGVCVGNGLSGLAERIAALGGSVHVGGNVGDGW